MAKTTYQSGKDLSVHRDRRLQASLVVILTWICVSLLHLVPELQWLIVGLTVVLAVQMFRMLLAKPANLVIEDDTYVPLVSIVVPAKNESAVLSDLVHSLFDVDYPRDRLDIWIVDDGSTDDTPDILSNLQTKFPDLQVYSRQSTNGKSAALNAVFPGTKGEMLLICDADAQLPINILRQTVPLFQNKGIGAVQVRKSIFNVHTNFLTRCQQMEMICDSFLQTHRIAVGGMSELRGNGMLLRRELIEKCQGWNEDTVTDDLDFCFKLYLVNSEIEFVTSLAIQEEGVTTWKQLWHQHCRWAEGGYQRFLDYFPQILTLGWKKEIDLLLFFLLQFLLPIALIPDLLWTLFYSDRSVLWPLQTILGIILTSAFIVGLYQYQNLRGLSLLWATIQGSLYMVHWVPMMMVVTLRMCVQKQRSRWIKTKHRGKNIYKEQNI
ncbi:glycosyltransferase family 2 protein [Tolypothrix sp. FACHB-123]|uniref:glycosyltransferase n=1 Tax=Tolypothrix sp. FACHB-123 TaxID=2692868 RepID=UPI001685D03B|nr:glycosyltransferase [Tolypothrix sp. FACHB-123]MBD2357328.1 glycosyltransferase family 2 protein [Tolypothrix sp. FACHB-123]